MRTIGAGRRTVLGATCCGLAAVVLIAGMSPGRQASAQAEAPVNPVRPVSPDDVQTDPSHGFLVLVEGDAGLYENETEGPVAVGGDIRFRAYQVALNNPGTYVAPGDDHVTGLVVGGAPDYEGSPAGGRLNVLTQTYAKIGDLGDSDVLPTGGETHVVPDGGGEGTHPQVDIQTPQPAESVGGDSGFDLPALFSIYRDLNTRMSRCAQTVQLTDQNGQEEWNGTDPVATLGLRPGQNVLELTEEELAALRFINPRNGYLQPGDEAWLVINVQVDGDYTWPVPEVSWQGTQPSTHVLWNFTTSGTITLPEGSPTVWGTVYAPNAGLVDESSANIEGNVVVRTFEHGGAVSGSGGANGGEVHYAPFADLIAPCADVPEPTTEPTTTGPTTTEPTTTDPTTATTEPTTTEPTPTGDVPTTTTEPTSTTTEPAPVAPTSPGDAGTGPEGTGGTDSTAGRLSETGTEVTPWLVLGLSLLGVGVLLLAGPALVRPRPGGRGSADDG
ncbi:collagen-binding domain-containing protein [Prauserella flavalba]|uniref:Choice-of-anchor A domain-containing protein n=1 Tax=Prauserella flavalba TaxID=1477506 RepID=A0A318LU09_9PSEU|nr:collagen-binding domain-containing protein [Prauserella flavalba]PXY35828.1 hypothetical protein BA062_10140 [Prauserella flavalba]